MHRWFAGLVLVALALSFSAGARAETQLNPELEERARALFLELRCVVCQNQSIGDSDADVGVICGKSCANRFRRVRQPANQDISGRPLRRVHPAEPLFAWHTLVLWVAPGFPAVVGRFHGLAGEHVCQARCSGRQFVGG